MFAQKVCPRVSVGSVGLLFIGIGMSIACSQPQQVRKASTLGGDSIEVQTGSEHTVPSVEVTVMDGNRPENRRAP